MQRICISPHLSDKGTSIKSVWLRLCRDARHEIESAFKSLRRKEFREKGCAWAR
jgi:hypothetical protein